MPRPDVAKTVRDHPLEALLGREVEWFDPQKLDRAERVDYCQEATRIASSKVLENERRHFFEDLRNQAFLKALSYDEVLILRHQYQGVEAFIKHLKSVRFVDNKETVAELDNEI